MRPLHFVCDDAQEFIFASTNRGTILKFNRNLNLISSSDPVYGLNNIYMICQDENYVYGREITGKLARWLKSDLRLDQIVDLNHWSDDQYAESPNVSHGLFCYQDAVYVSCPQGQIAKFSRNDLSFQQLSSYTPKALIEGVSTVEGSDHFAVDFAGYLYRGNIDVDMQPVARVAHGAAHQILYDRKFNRYWVTDDFHCGVAIFKSDNVTNIKRSFSTNDDVEWMSFNHDHSEILVACFDRFIYRLANAPDPRLIGKIGPLNYQVTQVEWIGRDQAVALTEAGDIYWIDVTSSKIENCSPGLNAVWDIRQDMLHKNQYFVALEDGTVHLISIEGLNLDIIASKKISAGMIRRIISEPNGDIITLGAMGEISCLGRDLQIKWTFHSESLLRDMTSLKNQLFVATENGELICLNTETGVELWQNKFPLPLWSISTSPDGKNILIGQRLRQRNDQGVESSPTPAGLLICNAENGELNRAISYFGNIKRIQWTDTNHFLINGNGDVNTSLIRWPSLERIQHWSEWQLNTCEAVVANSDYVYTTTYGFQLNTYTRNGELLDSAFPFEDYATSLVQLGADRLLAGGRGAFLKLFTLSEGIPRCVRHWRL